MILYRTELRCAIEDSFTDEGTFKMATFVDWLKFKGIMVINEGGLVPTEPSRSRTTDPVTSRDAAADQRAELIQRRRVAILKVLSDSARPLCGTEISVKSGIPEKTSSSALRPMARDGLIRVVGKKINPHTGKNVLAWSLV